MIFKVQSEMTNIEHDTSEPKAQMQPAKTLRSHEADHRDLREEEHRDA
jgi:hypothetical protein